LIELPPRFQRGAGVLNLDLWFAPQANFQCAFGTKKPALHFYDTTVFLMFSLKTQHVLRFAAYFLSGKLEMAKVAF